MQRVVDAGQRNRKEKKGKIREKAERIDRENLIIYREPYL